MAAVLYILIFLICGSSASHPQRKFPESPLRFKSDGTFKIAQFTDLHFGEGEDTWWGPEQDKNSTRVMNTILSIEKPDIVLLTGDMITGNNIFDNATAYWKMMLTPMINHQIPWAIAFGNHDDLASGTGGTRQDLMTFDRSFSQSYSQFGPKDIHGVSNYVLEVLSSTDDIGSLLYVLDSGDSQCEGAPNGCIYPDQVQWYTFTSDTYKKKYDKTIPALSFFHIPLQEYMNVWNQEICYGTNNDSVACQGLNSGVFAAFKYQGDVQAMFVGHNHGNDYCGSYENLTLCFGRHTGYGGYGTWERGARIIEIQENPWNVNTWIRFEDGRLEPSGVTHDPTPPFQSQCSS